MALLGAAVVSCTLTTSLDGLEGPPLSGTDGGTEASTADSGGDASIVIQTDAGLAYPSCATLPAGSPDGMYLIDPDGPGPHLSFRAYCDMTNDGGGWMLVTEAMLGAATSVQATAVKSKDDNDGLVLTVYANSPGCGSSVPATRHRQYIDDVPAWTRLRFHQTFRGYASCWHTFGGQEKPEAQPLDPNLVPFDKTLDTIRDQVRMGGSLGNAFDGVPAECHEDAHNFWAMVNGTASRSATVILRRRAPTAPAGLETGADCGLFGDGTSSGLDWEYREIYVK